jgi:hypothetical protein
MSRFVMRSELCSLALLVLGVAVRVASAQGASSFLMSPINGTYVKYPLVQPGCFCYKQFAITNASSTLYGVSSLMTTVSKRKVGFYAGGVVLLTVSGMSSF